jgi:hypothetical protein
MVKEKILARLPQGIQATQKHKFHTKSAYVQQEIPLLKKFSVITAHSLLHKLVSHKLWSTRIPTQKSAATNINQNKWRNRKHHN